MAKTSVSKKIATRRKAQPKLPRSVLGAVHAVQDKKAEDVIVTQHVTWDAALAGAGALAAAA